MSVAQQIAERVLARLKKEPAGTQMAVFLTPDNRDAKATKTTTDLFQTAMAKFPRKLIGIYTVEAEPEFIVDDLRYCGMTV